MAPSPRKPRRLAALLALVSIVVAACSSSEPSAATQPSTTLGEPTTTVSTPAETSVPTTTPPTSAAPATSAAPVTTAPVTTTTTTLPPTTTTTVPVSVQELVLRGDGIGSARFGAAPDDVIDYVTSILGGNTGDTGWVDPFTFAICEGDVARRVDWGVLSLLFSDFSDVAIGRRHFMGYEYGRLGELGDEPVGLQTPGGTGLGSRIVDLLADFPDATVNPGEEGIDIPPNFYVSDNFYGLVTGVEAEDLVTVIFGGYGCGA